MDIVRCSESDSIEEGMRSRSELKIVLGTVLYPGAEQFIPDFAESVNLQTDKKFDVLVINDGMGNSGTELLRKLLKHKVNIINTFPNAKIHENRIFLLEKAKKNKYDLLVMLDIDDKMSDSRIWEYRYQYDSFYAFYFNELYTFEGRKIFVKLPDEADIKDIMECNYLGLSNTGINLKLLDSEFLKSLYHGDTNVFDWYLFTRILLEKFRGKKIEQAITKYRIYNNNIAGINQNVQHEIKVKRKHYELLSNYDIRYRELFKIYQKSESEIKANMINEDIKGYWWENIAMLADKK